MAQPRFEVANGAIDGANRVFTLSTSYAPNTTAVFLNGKMQRRDWADGWVETDPATGTVTLNEAPFVDDTVQVFFLDTSPAVFGEELTPIRGVLSPVDFLTGTLVDPTC